MRKRRLRIRLSALILAFVLPLLLNISSARTFADDDEKPSRVSDSGFVGTDDYNMSFSVSGAKKVEQFDSISSPYGKSITIYADIGDTITIDYTVKFPDLDFCRYNLGLTHYTDEYEFRSYVYAGDTRFDCGGISGFREGSVTKTLKSDDKKIDDIEVVFKWWPKKDGLLADKYIPFKNLSENDAISWLSENAYMYLYISVSTGDEPSGADEKHTEIDASAESDEGEDEGDFIDDDIVEGSTKDDSDDDSSKAGAVGGAAIIGAAAAGVTAGKKKRKKNSTYKMHIYKDFGDTLRKNQAPIPIFARIVEVGEDGTETDATLLSERIKIFAGDDAVEVWDRGMSDVWKAAEVKAKDTNASEGVVCFRFMGAGGTFTKRLHFRIDSPCIRFSQDNIALPSCYPVEEPIEFVVEGMAEPEKTQVTAEMSYGSSYSVRVQKVEGLTGATGEPKNNVFVAVIKDINEKAGCSGTFTTQTLTVRATDGKVSLTGEIVVRRVSEGIYVSLKALNCYPVLKKDARRDEDGCYSASAYQSAETVAKAWLVLCDLEEHKVIRRSISPQIEFVNETDTDFRNKSFDEWNEAMDQKLDFDQLGIAYYVSERRNGVSVMKFYCGNGFLRTPARFKVKMNAAYKYGEREYVYSSEVLLRSQPARTAEQIRALRSMDEEMTKKLQQLIAFVEGHCLFDELCAEYTTAYAHYKSYDEAYGYDTETVERILEMFDLWRHNDYDAYYLEERRAIKAAQIPTDYSQIDWYGASGAMVDEYHKMNGTFSGLCIRMGIDYLTGGGMEAIFLPLDAAAKVREYNRTTPKEDQTLVGQIKAGAVPIVIAALIHYAKPIAGYAKYASDATGFTKVVKGTVSAGKWVYNKTSETVVWAGGRIITGTGKVLKPLADEATELSKALYDRLPQSWTEEIERSVKYIAETVKPFSPSQLYRRLMGSSEKAAGEAANYQLMELLRRLRRDPQGLEQEILTLANDAASLNGAKIVNNFAKAVKAGNEQTLKKLALEILNDPQAIEQLFKRTGANATALKKVFNRVLREKIYGPAEEATLEVLGKMYPGTKFRFSNVSAKAARALESGSTIGHDLDVTIEAFIEGEWRAIGQEAAAKAYSHGFCKANQIAFKSVDEAVEIIGAYQQHVCQSLKDPEFYIHVERLINPEHLGKGWNAAEMKLVQGTYEYKMLHLYRKGMKTLEEMSRSGKMEAVKKELTEFMEKHGSGAVPDVKELSYEAQQYLSASKDLYEAFRSGVKAAGQLADKNSALVMKGGSSVMTSKVIEGAESLKLVTKSAANAGEVNTLLNLTRGSEGYKSLVGEMSLSLKNVSEGLNNLNRV